MKTKIIAVLFAGLNLTLFVTVSCTQPIKIPQSKPKQIASPIIVASSPPRVKIIKPLVRKASAPVVKEIIEGPEGGAKHKMTDMVDVSLCFTSIVCGVKNEVWFGSYMGGVSCYSGGKFLTYSKEQGLYTDDITSITTDKKGILWIGSTFGLLTKFDGEFFSIYPVTAPPNIGTTPGSRINCLFIDKDDKLWVGSNTGVTCFNGSDFSSLTASEGLPCNTINCIFQDHKGTFWFGTDTGWVCQYDGKNFSTYAIPADLVGNKSVNSITEDKNGNLWIAASSGLYCYNGKALMDSTSSLSLLNRDKHINIKFTDESKNIFLFARNNISEFDGKKFRNLALLDSIHNDLASLTEDSIGNYWIGGCNGKFYKYDGKNVTTFQVK